jgi:excisionase family DNA binding protein
MASEKLLIRVRDAAEQLSVGRTTIYELIRAGKLDVAKIGRATRITQASIERYLLELGSSGGRL